MMRVAIGGISHETSTFSPAPADLSAFEVHEGGEIIDRFRATATPIGGFLEGAKRHGWEAVPTLVALAVPGGVVPAATFRSLTDRLLRRLEAEGPLDAVLLRQHGALVAEGEEDGDGWLLERVREVVGPGVPIGATLDLHANLSRRMAEASDLLIGYDTYPHVDGYERALEVVEGVDLLLRSPGALAGALAKPRVLASLPQMFTDREPMRSVIDRAHALESDIGGFVTVAGGFPYADVPDAGFGVLAYAPDRDRARAAVAELSAMIESRAQDFRMTGIRVDVAAKRARGHQGPGALVLADISDNPGAGGPCDGTVLLAALLEQGVENCLVLTMHDPAAVEAAQNAGVGQPVQVDLGGHADDRHGPPLRLWAQVERLCDGAFMHTGPMSTGLVGHMGPTALLRVGGVRVAVTSIRSQPLDLGMVEALGIDPRSVGVYVLKSSVHFRGAFTPIAADILEVDTPGVSNPDYTRFAYRRVLRPIFPLDAIEPGTRTEMSGE